MAYAVICILTFAQSIRKSSQAPYRYQRPLWRVCDWLWVWKSPQINSDYQFCSTFNFYTASLWHHLSITLSLSLSWNVNHTPLFAPPENTRTQTHTETHTHTHSQAQKPFEMLRFHRCITPQAPNTRTHIYSPVQHTTVTLKSHFRLIFH